MSSKIPELSVHPQPVTTRMTELCHLCFDSVYLHRVSLLKTEHAIISQKSKAAKLTAD